MQHVLQEVSSKTLDTIHATSVSKAPIHQHLDQPHVALVETASFRPRAAALSQHVRLSSPVALAWNFR